MKTHYTTTQAARLLSVSPDTVLKWVRAGKIDSYRTPGGHCRIPAGAVTALLPAGDTAADTSEAAHPDETSRYCWDYYAGPDGVREQCRECVAYRSQARRCYEMRDIPEEFGHLRLFCTSSCEDCEFYRLTYDQQLSVLVVSRNQGWIEDLEAQAPGSTLRLESATSEYACGALIERFRPDFIVIDTSFGRARTRAMCRLLRDDPRIPFARIIIASRRARWEEDCRRDVFGWIEKPFSVTQLAEFVRGADRGPNGSAPGAHGHGTQDHGTDGDDARDGGRVGRSPNGRNPGEPHTDGPSTRHPSTGERADT
jgi:excisionase family DNA binding protein